MMAQDDPTTDVPTIDQPANDEPTNDEPSTAAVVAVVDNPERERWELIVDDEVAGFVQYQRRGDRIIFFHTEVDPAFGGRGLGSELARGVLDGARVAGERVVPLCPFIHEFIHRHRDDYHDLVDHDLMHGFES